MKKTILHQKLINEKIEGFDILISPPPPAGNYVSVKKTGSLAYVSGQMSILSSGIVLSNKENNTIEFGYKAAEITMANVLKQLFYSKEVEEIQSIIRVDGYFNTKKAANLPKMLDGASDLISTIFGDKNGTHARTVFEVNALPYNAFLEIVVIAEIK